MLSGSAADWKFFLTFFPGCFYVKKIRWKFEFAPQAYEFFGRVVCFCRSACGLKLSVLLFFLQVDP
jgi:hypothetical protein